MAHLSPDQLKRGVLAASAGWLAGVAFRARELGIPCGGGAEHARRPNSGHCQAGRVIKVPFEPGGRRFRTVFSGVDATFIHADDPHDGWQWHHGLEILEDLPDVAAVLIPGAAAG